MEGLGAEVIDVSLKAVNPNGSEFVSTIGAGEVTGFVGVGEKTFVGRAQVNFSPDFGFKTRSEESNAAVFIDNAVFFKRIVFGGGGVAGKRFAVKEFNFTDGETANKAASASIVVEFVGSGQFAHDGANIIGGVLSVELFINTDGNEKMIVANHSGGNRYKVGLLIFPVIENAFAVDNAVLVDNGDDQFQIAFERIGVLFNIINPSLEKMPEIFRKENMKVTPVSDRHKRLVKAELNQAFKGAALSSACIEDRIFAGHDADSAKTLGGANFAIAFIGLINGSAEKIIARLLQVGEFAGRFRLVIADGQIVETGSDSHFIFIGRAHVAKQFALVGIAENGECELENRRFGRIFIAPDEELLIGQAENMKSGRDQSKAESILHDGLDVSVGDRNNLPDVQNFFENGNPVVG